MRNGPAAPARVTSRTRPHGRSRLAAVVVAACLLVPVVAAEADPFPRYDEIEGNVGFWVRVFTEWTEDRVAIHDLEYPALVYEVVSLSGPIEERYTRKQERFLEDTRDAWSDRLKRLATRVSSGAALSDEDKQLALRVARHAGTDGLKAADKRVRSQRGMRTRFRAGLERSYRWDTRFREIFRAAGLPEDLALLPHVESSFRASVRSSASAVGMWQFTRGTGRQFMTIDASIDERLDPVASARAAAAYMRAAHDRLGNWPLALTSYNHGVGGMARAQRHWGEFPAIVRNYKGRHFGFASKNFYAEFLAVRDIVANVEDHFPEGLTPDDAFELIDAELAQRTPPSQIALAYGVDLADLASLNPSWSAAAVRRDLALPRGTRVWLRPDVAEGRRDAATDSAALMLKIDGLVEEETHYRVRRGDTLTGIASRHGMTLDDLVGLNGIDARRPIRIGQRLTVRTGRVMGGLHVTEHVVRTGDTLGGIADRYGVSLRDLRGLNGLGSREDRIVVGQVLRVSSPQVHVVRRGETLSRIAGSYGVRLADLLRANRLDLRSTIFPGQKIRIPTRG